MSYITLKSGRRVGDFLKPYIVAELNTSHFGDISIAKRLIDKAAIAGCNCVKFQSWNSTSLYCEGYYHKNSIAKRIIEKFSLDSSTLKLLSSYAAEQNIDFASTPYSEDEAKFLIEECNVPFLKIASMDLNNLPYLRLLARLQIPLVLSTGMGTIQEIFQSVNNIQEAGNSNLIILHCTSVYPSDPDIVRLQNILGLRSEFPNFPIGFSDHSSGIEIAVASIALGASLIEKHFTLDHTRIGMDNHMATEPDELAAMVQACHRVHRAIGGTGRIIDREELNQIPKMRRSMTSKIQLNPGDVLTEQDFEFKRPGTGIPPTQAEQFIGKRVNKIIQAGFTINHDDFI